MTTRMVTNLQGLLPIMLLYPLVMWSCKITWQTKIISTTAMPMATKLCRGVTYHKGGPPIKSHGPWITCFCKIIWQTKTIISRLSQCYGYKAWDVVDLTWVSSSHDYVIRLSWEIRNMLKSPYIYYCNDRLPNMLDMQWEASTNKVAQPFEYVVTWGHMIN